VDPASAIRSHLRLSGGTSLSYLTAGRQSSPALLLLHGFPSSALSFRKLIPVLASNAYVVAPDLPGFGQSDPIADPSFEAFSGAIGELLEHLGVGARFIYLHDFGAPVGFDIAMRAPRDVLGLVIQNANAHTSGFDDGWAATRAFWADPTPQHEAAATTHLTLEGTRNQYVGNVPSDIASRIPAALWVEDWRVMQLPGRLETQRALVRDYGRYARRFDEIARYLSDHQPPALMLWGRHDSFFNLAETLSWMTALPRMEAHILDAGHFLLETSAGQAAKLMTDFIERQSYS
jgi:pimeloyl-ACP methyl ester carboxylesterase